MPRKSLSESGASPVMRVRVPDTLLDAAHAKARRNDATLAIVVRALLEWWITQPDAQQGH